MLDRVLTLALHRHLHGWVQPQFGAAHGGRRSMRLASAVAAAALLAACSGTAPKPLTQTEPTYQAESSPVPDAGPMHVEFVPSIETASAQPSVEQRLFPAPAQSFAAPGLSAGAQHFTSHEQLSAFLRQLPTPAGVQWKVERVGTSALGRAIEAVHIQPSSAANTPQKTSALPTVLIVAGQHGQASASTEAVLELLHRISQAAPPPASTVAAKPSQGGDSTQPPALPAWSQLVRQLRLIVIPRANPDGFAAQLPSTADGIALDADHLALRSAEAQTIAALLLSASADVVVDVGEFAAVDLPSVLLGGTLTTDVGLSAADPVPTHEFTARAAHQWFEQPVQQRLQALGWNTAAAVRPVAHEGTLVLHDESLGAASLAGSAALRGVVGLRLQSRGADLGRQHAQRRALSLLDGLHAIAAQAAARAQDLQQVRRFVAQDTTANACRGQFTLNTPLQTLSLPLPILLRDTAAPTSISLLWYTRSADTPSADAAPAQAVSSAVLAASVSRARPCGYWLSAANPAAITALRRLGVHMQQVAEAQAAHVAQTYLPPLPAQAGSFAVQRTLLDIAAGSWYVPLNQPSAALIAAALEPDAAHSFFVTGLIASVQDTARFVTAPRLVFEGR